MKLLAVAVGSALLLPLAPLPADAATTGSAVITNCAKTKDGATVRIKIRDEGRSLRIRVSHPQGTGNFHSSKVRSTLTSVLRESKAAPPDPSGGEIGSAIQIERGRTAPSFRTGPAWYRTVVSTDFKLRSGKTIHLSCTARR